MVHPSEVTGMLGTRSVSVLWREGQVAQGFAWGHLKMISFPLPAVSSIGWPLLNTDNLTYHSIFIKFLMMMSCLLHVCPSQGEGSLISRSPLGHFLSPRRGSFLGDFSCFSWSSLRKGCHNCTNAEALPTECSFMVFGSNLISKCPKESF